MCFVDVGTTTLKLCVFYCHARALHPTPSVFNSFDFPLSDQINSSTQCTNNNRLILFFVQKKREVRSDVPNGESRLTVKIKLIEMK